MGLLDLILPTASPDKFAKMMTSAMRRQGYDGPIRYERETFALRMGEGDKASTTFLNNTYQTYLKAPRTARSVLVNEFAMTIVTMPQTPETYEEAAANLLPRLRERFYYEALKLRVQLGEMEELKIPTAAVTEHLSAELALDSEMAIATVSEQVSKDWDATPEQMHQQARDNLWKRSNKNFEEVVPGLYISAWQDCWDAARMLLHDLIWQLKVKGAHVAVAPHRDLLIVTGSEDEDGLAALAELAERQQDNPRPMAPYPAVIEGNGWKDFNPAKGEPGHEAIHRLRMIAQARDYTEQQELLNALLEQGGEDVFIASFSVVEGDDMGLFSYCTWTADCVAQLPRADQIIFGRVTSETDSETLGMAAWEDVARVMGDRLKPVGVYPERYAVDSFPTQSEFAAMNLKPLD